MSQHDSLRELKRRRGLKRGTSLYEVAADEMESLDVISDLFKHLDSKYGLSPKEVLSIMSKKEEYLTVTACVLRQGLSPLQSVVKYLKEEIGLRIVEIAKALGRNPTTVWTTYRNSVRKRKERLVIERDEFNIPVSVINDAKLSCLEAIVAYLKEQRKLSFHRIAELLGKDDRTIWTVYNRAGKKLR